MRYLGIFLVCLASIAFEILLVRHFAITNWSEYGYWVISMAMAGYSVSGVVLCLFGDFFERRAKTLFFALPAAMLLLMALGYSALGLIPFNPLELQNEVLWPDQLANIGKYYLALFPFFFASGLYVGLSFLACQEDIPKVYMADLVGAGLGAAALLACLGLVPPFHAPLLLLAPLALAAWTSPPFDRATAGPSTMAKRAVWLGLPLLALAAGAWLVLFHNNAAYSQYKPVSAALNVEDCRILKEVRSPRGHYLLLESYLERHDPDLSNNYELLEAGGPPPAIGLYRDGERLAALPRSAAEDTGYLRAALDSLPYLLRPQERVLLAGSRGGFRLREALELGARHVQAVESDPVLLDIIAAHGPSRAPAGHSLRLPAQPGEPQAQPGDGDTAPGRDAPKGEAAPTRLASPLALAARAEVPFSLIDVSPEFLDQGQANKYLLTAEGVARLIQALGPDGLLSLPMGISELPVYALKAAATLRAGLMLAGAAEPGRHILVVRSSFTARLVVSRRPFDARDIAALRQFAGERSFDTPYYPGINPAEIEVFNDLPPVSFEAVTTEAGAEGDAAARDALMDDLTAFLAQGKADASSFRFFNLEPSTQDRPFFHEIIRLSRIPDALARIELLPRQEIGYLVNVAVLAQAALFALIVFLLPLVRRRGMGAMGPGRILGGFGYFLCLGLGFLFVEITLIERVTFLLNDPALAFALVLSAMLIASGLGSAFSSRFVPRPRAGIRLACGLAATLAAASGLLLPRLLDLALAWPDPAKMALTVAIAAPMGFFMGMPFPLALSTYRGPNSAFIPWAWSVNGALSVVATPLANILAVSLGYSSVFACSLGLYALAAILAPDRRET